MAIIHLLLSFVATVPPEVASKQPYDSSCDVFSFSLLFWEILALRDTPFHGYAPKEYFQRVVKGNERPTIKTKWPDLSKQSLKESFLVNPKDRPLMKRVKGKSDDWELERKCFKCQIVSYTNHSPL